MIREILVRDVIEKNDCAGKKLIFVTSMEEDESAKSLFRLTPAYMFSHEKLLLASISPMDKASVIFDHHHYPSHIVGEYVDIVSEVTTRSPICRCGTFMVSDGFDVYCSNLQCPLTLTTRIQRLASTAFADPMIGELDPLTGMPYQDYSSLEYLSYFKPFHMLSQGSFWRYPGGSLEHILLSKMIPSPTLATFLVEPLFNEFLESLYQNEYMDRSLTPISQFYADMVELIQRRDYTSVRQDKLIKSFIHSLGLESIKDHVLSKLVQYERYMSENTIEPMLAYAYALTHTSELINELGLHPSEAKTIVNEVYLRRYELCDIFFHYTNNNQDIVESFKHMM